MTKKIILKPVAPPDSSPARDVADIIADIRQLYFRATRKTIERNFEQAIDLLKSIPDPEDRQKATVYLTGLAEMRREFSGGPSPRTSGPRSGPARKRSGR